MKKEIVQKPQSKIPSRKRRLLNIGIVIIILCISYDVIAVGNIAYVAKWVSCGKQPVIVYSSYNPSMNRLEGGIARHVNFFTEKHAIIQVYSGSNMYCTESEAYADEVFIWQ